jgi:LytS/YehU family sensor histidine kinase
MNRKIEKRTFELQKTISQTELLGLKNQINPHFFYNVLNFLYSQSLQSFDKLSDPILTLSEMMRYSIIENLENNKVLLENEIGYLQNFIKLENLQNDGNKKIKLNVLGNPQYRRIIPLCLVPFIENIYRYAEIDNRKEYLIVTLEIHEEKISLSSIYRKNKNVMEAIVNEDFYKIKQNIITKYSSKCSVEFNFKNQVYTFLCTISL